MALEGFAPIKGGGGVGAVRSVFTDRNTRRPPTALVIIIRKIWAVSATEFLTSFKNLGRENNFKKPIARFVFF
jgi:hypothetical protein